MRFRSLRAPLALAFALGLGARTASADAIAPFDGECPPGLERAIRRHSEVCIPAACRTGHDCAEGSTCESVFECWASRPYDGDGRLAPGSPTRDVDTVIGVCREGHHCSEGACRERRECEPSAATPAWDPGERRWTRTPYQAPTSGGCNASAGHRPASTLLLAFLGSMALLWGRALLWGKASRR